MDFARPNDNAPTGDYANFDQREAEGHLLLIDVLDVEEVQTKNYGLRPAVRCNITDIDADTTYDNQLLFGAVIVPALSGQVGAKVLGRWAKGEARGGNNPPWVLKDYTDTDREQALAYLATSPEPAAGGDDDDIDALQRKLEAKQRKLLETKLGAKPI